MAEDITISGEMDTDRDAQADEFELGSVSFPYWMPQAIIFPLSPFS